MNRGQGTIEREQSHVRLRKCQNFPITWNTVYRFPMRTFPHVSRISLSPSTLRWIEGIKGARLNKRGNEGERPRSRRENGTWPANINYTSAVSNKLPSNFNDCRRLFAYERVELKLLLTACARRCFKLLTLSILDWTWISVSLRKLLTSWNRKIN